MSSWCTALGVGRSLPYPCSTKERTIETFSEIKLPDWEVQ